MENTKTVNLNWMLFNHQCQHVTTHFDSVTYYYWLLNQLHMSCTDRQLRIGYLTNGHVTTYVNIDVTKVAKPVYLLMLRQFC